MKLSENELVGLWQTLVLRQGLSESEYRSLAHLVGGILFGEDPGAEFRTRKRRGRPSNENSVWPVMHSEILRRRLVLAKDADLQVCSHWGIKPETLKKYRRIHGAIVRTDVDRASSQGMLDAMLSHVTEKTSERDEI